LVQFFNEEANYLNSLYKNLFFWAIIVIVMVLLFNFFNKPRQTFLDKNYSDFISAVEENKVLEVEAKGRNITWRDTEGRQYKTYAPEDPEMIKILREKRVMINAKREEDTPFWQNVLISWFPMILLIGVWIFFMKQVQMGGGKALSFGKSKAKILTKSSIVSPSKTSLALKRQKENWRRSSPSSGIPRDSRNWGGEFRRESF
jgi:cell division protease FtsH